MENPNIKELQSQIESTQLDLNAEIAKKNYTVSAADKIIWNINRRLLSLKSQLDAAPLTLPDPTVVTTQE